MSLYVIKPQFVTDHWAKEIELEGLTLKARQNNVRMYLTTMQDKKIEVDTTHKDCTTYDMQLMNTLIFDELSNTDCK